MKADTFFLYLLIMAGVTYVIRVIPFVLFRKKIKNRFVQSFLGYVPYAVLGAMTFPAIFTSTSQFPAAMAGTIVAVIVSFYEKSLLVVALSACAAVLCCNFILGIF
ncbi:MAG: AzlD domain-containing protein [Lachnospiraceae bacterium]